MVLINKVFPTTKGNNLRVNLTLDEFTGVFKFFIEKNHDVISETSFRDPHFKFTSDPEDRDVPIEITESMLDSYEFRNLLEAVRKFNLMEGRKDEN